MDCAQVEIMSEVEITTQERQVGRGWSGHFDAGYRYVPYLPR
jgi:hypothetical protein